MDMQDTRYKSTVSKYLNFLFTRSASLGEDFYIHMEIDGMYLGGGGFAVVLLELRDVENAAEYFSLTERLEQILCEKLARFAIHYVDSYDNRLSCLLAFPRLRANTPAVAEQMAQLRRILEDVHKIFTGETGKGLICAASNMEFGTAGIQMAYSELTDHLQYLRFMQMDSGVAALSDAEGSTRSQMDENLFLSDCADDGRDPTDPSGRCGTVLADASDSTGGDGTAA